MKRRHRNKKRPTRLIRLWTQGEADKVVPYLRSIVGSLREHWLTWQSHQRDVARLEQAAGPRGRDRILAETAARDSSERAEARFHDALGELSKIDVFLTDPVQGLALIPFRKEDDLAWFVYDQFDKRGLVGWRLHEDPLEQRRPLNLLDAPVASGPAAE